VGTGRVALPLAERGIDVHGIDASEAMVARLRSKRGERIPVTLGDFADVPVAGQYTLVYIVFNTLFALQTQEAQVRCFENVAAHLADDGVFVVEAFVPDVTPSTATSGSRRFRSASTTPGSHSPATIPPSSGSKASTSP
jgi:SAM-dependent methyltransferase